jgi:D-lactate dehydrogenase (cytochrome)
MPEKLPTQLFDKRQLITDPVELLTYEIDAGFDRGKPDGVFYPQSTADVSRLMRWASEHKVPMIARGAGTGLSGGAVPEHGGIIIEFARLNRILELDLLGRSAIVEPGLINLALDTSVKKEGFYYPPDPSSGRSSTLGGNLGENAGGPHCFKYGVTTNYVTGLEVVLADGQIMRLGGRALDYPEYDLAGILVGSEGTLGVITQAQVRLIRNPTGVKTMMVSFDSVEVAGQAVSAIIAAGLVPATLEMMDQKVMRMIEDFCAPGLPVNAGAGLIVEVDGYPASLDSQMEEIADLLTQHGGFDLRLAGSEEERQRIWYGRKSAAGAFSRLSPTFYLVDVTVPRSRLADMLTEVNQVCDRHQLRTGHVFHAGDGNLHPAILCDARKPDVMQRVFKACDEIVALCLARDGSITGEHGVGIEKRKYMPAMYTPAELSAMLDLKHLLDPHKLLNPGKIFPDVAPEPDYVPPVMPTPGVFAPTTATEAAAGLLALTQAQQPVQIGNQVDESAGHVQWLATHKLRGIKEFALDDLYVIVGAGTPVQELQDFLAQHQMQAPLAAPWPEATVGGVIAANLNSPLRIRYGSLRDVMLCATVALADGRVIRAGRNVVKNVAGYDLPKLFVGSYGTLGLLIDITLKFIPRPRAQRSLCVPVDNPQQGLAWGTQLLPKLLVASGLVLHQGASIAGVPSAPYTLVLTAEGVPEDVNAEIDQAQALLRSAGAKGVSLVETHSAVGQWATLLGSVTADQLLGRMGVPPKDLPRYCQQIGQGMHRQTQWLWDIPNGLAYAVAAVNDVDFAKTWLQAVRQPALAAGGYTVAMATPASLRPQIDPWGYRPDALALMRSLKARWDPAGILNPGTFVV